MSDTSTAIAKLLNLLDDVFADEGGSARYFDLRDELFEYVDRYPEIAPVVRASGYPV